MSVPNTGQRFNRISYLISRNTRPCNNNKRPGRTLFVVPVARIIRSGARGRYFVRDKKTYSGIHIVRDGEKRCRRLDVGTRARVSVDRRAFSVPPVRTVVVQVCVRVCVCGGGGERTRLSSSLFSEEYDGRKLRKSLNYTERREPGFFF